MDFVSVVFLVHSRHIFHDKVLLVVYIQVFGFLIDVPLYRGTTPIISSGDSLGMGVGLCYPHGLGRGTLMKTLA